MSLSQVKSVIESFVQNNNNDLLTIKGNWGVGKTYFWQTTIAEISKKGNIGKTNYSYVSLFGVDSFETLKNSIMANQIRSTAIGKDFNVSASILLSKGKNIAKHLEKSNYIRNFSGGLGSELAFQFVKDAVICFDDLERKSDKFDIKEILGLASFLKEQRNCKIVFILNSNILSDTDKESFSKHNEKVVDIELNFAPLPEEAFSYIFDESCPYFELIKFSCLTLKIENVRILQRIKRFIKDLIPHLQSVEKVVAEEVIRSIIIVVWSYFNKDNQIISIDFLRDFSRINLYIKKDIRKEEIDKEEEKKYKLLAEYGFAGADEVDKQLILFVEKGYLGQDFFNELSKKNMQAIVKKGIDSYSEAWDIYGTSFDLDEEFFIEKLVSGFRENQEFLSIENLNNTIDVLRKLNRDDIANSLIDEFILKKIDYKRLVEIKRLAHFHKCTDNYFLEKLNQIPKPSEKLTFAEAIGKLYSEYLYQDAISFLANCDVKEYYNFFKNEKSEGTYYSAKTLLSAENIKNEEQQMIYKKTKEALIQIAKESEINRIRISDWFNIEIE